MISKQPICLSVRHTHTRSQTHSVESQTDWATEYRYYTHSYGVSPEKAERWSKLQKYFTVHTTQLNSTSNYGRRCRTLLTKVLSPHQCVI